MDSFHIEEMDKGVIFVRENAPVENIYFIGKGIIEAIDYRVHGVAYEFSGSIMCMQWVGWSTSWI